MIFAFTLGSSGEAGRSFLVDLGQAENSALFSAFLGGIVFNLANLLVVAAIDLAGMAVAFPVGIGIALVLGVIVNYVADPVGNPYLLFAGVALVTIAIVIDAVAYKEKSDSKEETPTKGIVYAVIGGILMGFFYRFVAASIAPDFANPAAGLLTPYTAVVVFSCGILVSNFLWNSYFMFNPVKGEKVGYADYIRMGNPQLHVIGILGGIIWCIGMSLSIISGEKAGFAISYGLGQGATMVAAAWGVFIWKEFEGVAQKTQNKIWMMFLFFIVGLGLIIYSRLI